MAKKSKKSSDDDRLIIKNRRALHDYHIEETFEAGIALQGWEVKSLRANRANLNDSYALVRKNELWLLGFHISALETASTHVKPTPTRTRKLLLHRREIDKLLGLIKQQGYTLIPLKLYWSKNNKAKVALGLAKGKQTHDKRAASKERDWQRQRERLLKQ